MIVRKENYVHSTVRGQGEKHLDLRPARKGAGDTVWIDICTSGRQIGEQKTPGQRSMGALQVLTFSADSKAKKVR